MRQRLLLVLLLALMGGIFTTVYQTTTAETPDPYPIAETPPAVTVTPTIDRLAAPPTVENPNQADEGAQLFWLHCQPCHGDVGQGLTDEWREQYPEEDQNCWTSGCHGNRPYENGFTLPTAVPAVIGGDSLDKFETMDQVYGFMSAAMPYQDPGYLTEEEYLAMTAFLAREHGVWDGTTLNNDNLANFRLRPAAATPTPEPSATNQIAAENEAQDSDNSSGGFLGGIVFGLLCAVVVIILLTRRKIKNVADETN